MFALYWTGEISIPKFANTKLRGYKIFINIKIQNKLLIKPDHVSVDNIDNDKLSFCLIDITWQYPRSYSLQVVFSDCGNDRCVLIYNASIS